MTATLAKIGATSLLNFEDVDPTTRDEITASLTRFRSDFPMVADALQVIRLGGPEFEENPGGYAFTQDDGLGNLVIGLNPNAYGIGRRPVLERHAREDFDARWHGYWQPAGVLEHELCHVIDMTLGHAYGIQPSYGIEYSDAKSVSEYATYGGPFETLADSFAAWRLGNPHYGNRNIRRVLEFCVTHAGGHYADH